jgi:hypothetical protein
LEKTKTQKMSKLIEAKQRLYGLLLRLPDPTDKEIDIMYELSKDEDIQELLTQNKDETK